MFRTSACLAIALGIAAMGSAITPASALSSHYLGGANSLSGASTKMKPVEVPYGQLPRPQTVPTVRLPHCAVINCIVPSGNRAGG